VVFALGDSLYPVGSAAHLNNICRAFPRISAGGSQSSLPNQSFSSTACQYWLSKMYCRRKGSTDEWIGFRNLSCSREEPSSGSVNQSQGDYFAIVSWLVCRYSRTKMLPPVHLGYCKSVVFVVIMPDKLN